MLNRFAQFNICILNSVKLFNAKISGVLFTAFIIPFQTFAKAHYLKFTKPKENLSYKSCGSPSPQDAVQGVRGF
jgi:hypothetical protein